MAPVSSSPASQQQPFTIYSDGSYVFDFMVRRAEGVSLGLGVTHSDGDHFLNVQDVKPSGAIASWNRQCAVGPAAAKTVIPGDKILRVNTAMDPDSMLAECRENRLLRITVARAASGPPALPGDGALPMPPSHAEVSPAAAAVPAVSIETSTTEPAAPSAKAAPPLSLAPPAPLEAPALALPAKALPAALRSMATAHSEPSALRADASEFRPQGANAAEAAPGPESLTAEPAVEWPSLSPPSDTALSADACEFVPGSAAMSFQTSQ